MRKLIDSAIYWLHEQDAIWRQDFNEARYWSEMRQALWS